MIDVEDILLYFSLKYKGQFDLIYKALERKERVDESLKEELFKTIKSSYTTIISDDYPQKLKYINCPPLNCKMKLELRNWDKGACPFIPIRAVAGPLF